MKYFHGTSSKKKGQLILKEGILPDLSLTQGIAKPVEGMVYLTTNLDYAIIYLKPGKEYCSWCLEKRLLNSLKLINKI